MLVGVSKVEMPDFAADPALVSEYRALVASEFADGAKGRLLFCLSTDDLTQSRGDLYVGMGLAKYLRRLGWGVTMWPISRWPEETPEGMDIAIVMIESFVPGLVREGTRLIAWIRNWTDTWAALPYLDQFTQLWCSSEASAAVMRQHFDGPVHVLPLATDIELFSRVDVPRQSGVVTTANFWGVNRTLIAALTELAARESVTWFGKNAKHLHLPEGIDHRHTIDYFSLPWVYSSWRYVIDDVIPSAADYGTQNSRLFDAIACGAIILTNSRNGLRELGLGDVPVYDDADSLLAMIEHLRGTPDEGIWLGDHLQAIVRARHTYAHRAESASEFLTEALAATDVLPRPQMLRWASHLREELRASEANRSELRGLHYDLSQQYEALVAREEDLRKRLGMTWTARAKRAARMVISPRRIRERLRQIRSS